MPIQSEVDVNDRTSTPNVHKWGRRSSIDRHQRELDALLRTIRARTGLDRSALRVLPLDEAERLFADFEKKFEAARDVRDCVSIESTDRTGLASALARVPLADVDVVVFVHDADTLAALVLKVNDFLHHAMTFVDIDGATVRAGRRGFRSGLVLDSTELPDEPSVYEVTAWGDWGAMVDFCAEAIKG